MQKTISNAKKTHHIIQLDTINAELKQPELPIMMYYGYPSSYCDCAVWVG